VSYQQPEKTLRVAVIPKWRESLMPAVLISSLAICADQKPSVWQFCLPEFKVGVCRWKRSGLSGMDNNGAA
jgi:hypothetical protein